MNNRRKSNMWSIQNNIVKYAYILLGILATVFVIFNGAATYADTRAYFGMWPYVSAGYPFFLRGLHFLVGDAYASVAIWIQLIVVLVSIYIFVFHFLVRFQLKRYQGLIILGILFYPIFDNNVLMVTNVTTEGVSFALFLQIVFVSYLAFTERKLKHYILLSFLTIILITIRGQFQFLLPVFVIIELLLWWKERHLKWKHYLLILSIPLFTFAIDNIYHRVVQKQFFSTPFTFTALITSVLFVADDTDVRYLETDEQKNVFNLVKSQFHKKGIGYQDHKYYEEPIDWNYFFYHYEFPTLCNQTVQEDVLFFYLGDKERNITNVVDAYLKLESMHKQLFVKLMPHVLTKWAALAFQNFKAGIGGVSVALLYLLSLLLLLKRFITHQENIVLFSVFLLLSILLNHVLISISIHGLTRYFFYTHWMPIVLLFLGINKFTENKLKT